ncbi:hypothetical protein [Cerasicoccus arenae]|nr:hypothetical protein [Cerasicoccus arenae]
MTWAQEPQPMVDCQLSLYYVGGRARGAQAVAQEGERASETLYYSTNGQMKGVTIKSGQRTPEFSYVGPLEFKLYRKTGTDNVGQPIYSPVGKYQLLPGIRRMMISMIDQGTRFSLIPIDLSKAQEQKNNALIFNLSSMPIVCQAGEKQFNLDPLQSKTISLSSVKSDLQFEIKCAIQVDNEWSLVYSGSQTIRKGNYYVFLLMPDDDGKTYRIVRFRT